MNTGVRRLSFGTVYDRLLLTVLTLGVFYFGYFAFSVLAEMFADVRQMKVIVEQLRHDQISR